MSTTRKLGEEKIIGSYKTKEEAIAARKVAQKILYGEYDFDANNLSRFEILS